MSTTNSVTPFCTDLSAARGGDLDALGRLFESSRTYLLMVANGEIDDRVRAKSGASDVVQDTLFDAHRKFAGFRGQSEDDLRAWLRRALLNNLQDLTRLYVQTLKRSIGGEVPLDASPHGALVDPRLTPGATVAARDEAARLDRALERLSDDDREVITLRFRQDMAFAEIGRRMHRSEDAARMLLFRAVERLQTLLEIGHDAARRRHPD